MEIHKKLESKGSHIHTPIFHIITTHTKNLQAILKLKKIKS